MILSLQHFNQNNNRLFWGGFIVGSIIEYVVSWIGEVILNVKWWDYSNMPLNLNGRICVFFSIVRKVHENNLPIVNKERADIAYERIYSNEQLAEFINKFWDDRKMIRTFPNLKIKDKDGNIIYFADYVGDIQPYYYKFNFNLKKNKDEIFDNAD